MEPTSFAGADIGAAGVAQLASPKPRATTRATSRRTNAPTADARLPHASQQHPESRRIVPGRDKSTQSRTSAAIELYGASASGESYTGYLRSAQKCSQCTAPCSNRSGLPMRPAQYCGVLTRMAVALLAVPVLFFPGWGAARVRPEFCAGTRSQCSARQPAQ